MEDSALPPDPGPNPSYTSPVKAVPAGDPCGGGVPYTIGGVPVVFPVKAYPSQVAIMAKVIKGLQSAQNCLLESPTGSGKTLALLCSSLAWQRQETEKVRRQMEEYNRERSVRMQEEAEKKEQKAEKKAPKSAPASSTSACTCRQSSSSTQENERNNDISDEEDRNAFKPASKKRKIKGKGVIFIDYEENEKSPQKPTPAASSWECHCQANTIDHSPEEDKASWKTLPSDDTQQIENDDLDDRPQLPKIFYGTRTHKQIEQIIRELKKTIYRGTKMTILSSREHTCIHPLPKTSRNKTELCHELLDPRQGEGCRFKSNGDSLRVHEALEQYGCPEPWDIEDLVTLGYKLRVCPYFTARNLLVTADLIFCPYNYLVDPQIQSSMQLNLNGNIIIFDEAHNIEDTAREAASLTVDYDDINAAAEDCRLVAHAGRLAASYGILEDFLIKLSGWIEAQDDKLRSTEYDRSSFTWFGTDAIASFEHYGVGLNPFYEFKHATKSAIENLMTKSEEDEFGSLPAMSGKTKVICDGLCYILSYMYDNEMMYREDYRVTIIKSVSRKQVRSSQPVSGQWVNMSQRDIVEARFERKLNFWCQNPAVAMNDLRKKTRSIILTSGTLAPIDSFSSELGVHFPIQFEANHIITPSQVWVSSISHGPRNLCLNAQYKNAETYEFQDELGRLVLEVCRMVPYGVLCFFPSYKMLDKLQARWQSTGIWAELEQHKNVLCEPRRGDELENVMMEFYRSIEQPEYVSSETTLCDWQRDSCSPNGALLMAIHRGKVSEGMDFADNQARAVIAVGIPYPNFKDTKVELKRQYNDLYSKPRGLLSGSRWYEIQAYRALNQALGRCIRHRNDWGAILLVDDRFAKGPYYTNGLSKWIRNMLQHHTNWSTFCNSLKSFTTTRIQQDEQPRS